jgi:ArsR family transcriptional regulator
MKKVIPLIEQNQETCCGPAVPVTLDKAQADTAVELFSALADPVRLSILKLLAQNESEVCVCDITAVTTNKEGRILSQPTISHHLKILQEARLITGDKRGKWVYYSLVRSKVEEVKALLEQFLGVPVLV